MNNQTCKTAGKPKACPKKVTELFYVTHPKAPKALMGPFLTEADAECGRTVMRSPDALVTAALVDSIDEMTQWHGVNNGAICRAFAGTSGGHHE
ncbi:hypothetical protein QN391_00620 [Pseudomonas sp. CCI1.2]|uniref:hypothetical protein n=1 Tax=Pseudomonas sp. CCI1.2 TaxID=3048614 RepID=UPI002B23EAE6|nr:hypothetical protein [Pseudomonas sp. CCI1.2]MEB0119210.1 hypothetical protein [Pseudomonas sp. CCI1.2]